MKALSIRQPWAWLIVEGHKDVENRTWKTNYRGEFYIHASSQVSPNIENIYMDLKRMYDDLFIPPPNKRHWKTGGIVGQAKLIDCVEEHTSKWFIKEPENYGFVLEEQKRTDFVPCKGQLGFFDTKLENSHNFFGC